MTRHKGLGFGWAATLASLAAPLAVVLRYAISLDFGWRLPFLIFLFGTPISLLVTWLLGLPFVLYLRRLKLLNIVAVCAGGIVIGAAFLVVALWLVSSVPESIAQVFEQSVVGGLLGLVVAVAFCLLARIPLRTLRAASPSI